MKNRYKTLLLPLIFLGAFFISGTARASYYQQNGQNIKLQYNTATGFVTPSNTSTPLASGGINLNPATSYNATSSYVTGIDLIISTPTPNAAANGTLQVQYSCNSGTITSNETLSEGRIGKNPGIALFTFSPNANCPDLSSQRVVSISVSYQSLGTTNLSEIDLSGTTNPIAGASFDSSALYEAAVLVHDNISSTGGFGVINTAAPEIVCDFNALKTGIAVVDGAGNGALNGICSIFQYLFVPDQEALSQFTGEQSVMATKPPFNYFYNLTGTLQTLSASSSTSTMSGLKLTIGASSSPIHFTADMFSTSTMDQFTDSNSRNLLRTICEYAIYLAFAAMIIFEVRHLFKPNPPK